MIKFFYRTPPVAASVFRVYFFDMIAHVYDKLTSVQVSGYGSGNYSKNGNKSSV